MIGDCPERAVWLAEGPERIGSMWVEACTEDEARKTGLELFQLADASLTIDDVTAQRICSRSEWPDE